MARTRTDEIRDSAREFPYMMRGADARNVVEELLALLEAADAKIRRLTSPRPYVVRNPQPTGRLPSPNQRVVLALLAEHIELTCDEAEQLTGLSHQVMSPRFSECCKAGWIARQHRRPTRLGSTAYSYKLTELGTNVLARITERENT